jgi:hypothetical protein
MTPPAGFCILTIGPETGNISNVIPAEAGNSYTYDDVGNRTSMAMTDNSVTSKNSRIVWPAQRGRKPNRQEK